MLCPAAALVLLLHHHGQAAHVFVILAIPYLIGMPRIDLGACFAPSGCLLVVTTGSNRPEADVQQGCKQGRIIGAWIIVAHDCWPCTGDVTMVGHASHAQRLARFSDYHHAQRL